MTTTGYSCIHRKAKTRHGCQVSTEYYCELSGQIVDPMICGRGCHNFCKRVLQCRTIKKLEVELL